MTSSIRDRRGFWPGYRTVWRWHFYAGLLCLPVVCFLAVTGAIYLFRPQVDAWLDQPYDHLAAPQTAAPSRVAEAALSANPGWVLHAYQLPRTAQSAAQLLLGRNGVERRVYVDRGALRVVKSEPENSRFMQVIFHLHGELLLGDRGSMIVELAASWAIVMILTGLYLWWPRGASGLAGVLYPRLGAGGRLVWRDLHAVTGVWVSAFALFMLVSGLPWASNWGGYLKEVRALTGTASAHQDWTTGSGSEIRRNRAMDAAAMAGMSGMSANAGAAAPLDLTALDRAVPTMAALHLPPPVLISPPSRPGGPWTGRSETQDRPLRVSVTLDPATGALLSRRGFAQQDLIDQAVAVGVAWHEGQLFGPANQALGVLIALGLLMMSVSAAVMWWRRRDLGVLGAPAPAGPPRLSAGLAALVVILGVLLPLFGLSLIAVLAIERLVLRRTPGVRDWLGLRPA